MLIDAHCHLNAFTLQQIDGIVSGLNNNYCLIDSSIDFKSSLVSLELSKKFDFVYSALGFHPFNAHEFSQSVWEDYQRLIRDNSKVAAIGEVGLDYKAQLPQDKQTEVFRAFIELSKSQDLALIIHNRLDSLRVLEILDDYFSSYESVIFHCFSYSSDFLTKIVEKKGLVSFSLNILRKKKALVEALKICPLENLLLETDCPYMKIDSRQSLPLDVARVYDFAAETKGIARAELEKVVYANARRVLFKK